MPTQDWPSCDFLKANIKAERDAIEAYTAEAARTDDIVWKRSINSVAIDEMHHLEMLESLSARIKCEK